jgi:hypothetical protein
MSTTFFANDRSPSAIARAIDLAACAAIVRRALVSPTPHARASDDDERALSALSLRDVASPVTSPRISASLSSRTVDRPMRTVLFPLLALSLAALAGCSSETSLEGASCRTGAECASGVCLASGTCEPAPLTDGGLGPGDGAPPLSGDSGACVPNADGRIDRAEFPVRAGLRATYTYGTNVAIDLAGITTGTETRWNFKGPFTSDTTRVVDVQAPAGKWWAAAFPSASYALTLGASGDLLGVFTLGATELALAGVVSPSDGATKTQLAYDPAPAFLRFPLRVGDSWTSTSTVTGTAQGLAIGPLTGTQYTETYATTVDAAGTVEVPFGTFKVVRVLTSLTRRNQAGLPIATLPDRKTVAFVAECFGTVASATSAGGETRALFTTASELQRLAP